MIRQAIAKRGPILVVAVCCALAPVLTGSVWKTADAYVDLTDSPYPLRIELPAAKPLPVSRHSTPTLLQDAHDPDPPDKATELSLADANVTSSVPNFARSNEATAVAIVNGLLPLGFDLADPLRTSSNGAHAAAFDVLKSVRLNGTKMGTATVRIGAGSALYISTVELGGLLEGAGRPDLAGRLEELGDTGPFVSFDQVRRQGLSVRYDAINDRILISD